MRGAAQRTIAAMNIEIRALAPEGLNDFLGFFEGEAFADNPKWASCFCQFLYVDHRVVHWPGRSHDENRAAACERIACGRMQGWLAFDEGRPVAWCSAAPRRLMAAFDDAPDPEAGHIGQIGCFVVAKSHRRSGIATRLLNAACEAFRAQGLRIAEATPLSGAGTDAQQHYGPLAMFLAAGFVPLREEDGKTIVRRSLLD